MKTVLLAAAALVAAVLPATAQIQPLGNGSGVAIGPHEILTANHVIEGCTSLTVNQGEMPATVVATDKRNDLAVIYVGDEMAGIVLVRDELERYVRIGDEVIVMGYPLQGIVSSTPSLTVGNISAQSGFRDNSSEYTFTAPVQPGNSGGPLLDANGHLIGIVTSQLKPGAAQNINFAVKQWVINIFLRGRGIKYETAPAINEKVTPGDVGEKARLFTVRINCYGNASAVARGPEQPQSPPQSPSPPSEPVLPVCSSEQVFNTLKNIGAKSGIMLFGGSAWEMTGGNANVRYCRAYTYSTRGKRYINYYVTWSDRAARQFWVQVTWYSAPMP